MLEKIRDAFEILLTLCIFAVMFPIILFFHVWDNRHEKIH